MSIASYPEEMMPDLINVVFSEEHIPVIHLSTRHFRQCKNYNSVATYIISIFSSTIIKSRELYERDTELFDLRVDMSGTSKKNINLSFIRHLLKTLIKMFPGVLERCEIYNAPSFFRPIYEVLKFVIPPDSRKRVHFMD